MIEKFKEYHMKANLWAEENPQTYWFCVGFANATVFWWIVL